MPIRAFVVHKQWIVMWACFLSVGWLLPNHARPWTTFHHDAWCALASAMTAAPLLFRTTGSWAVPRLAVFLGMVACIPLLQWALGLNPVAGYAGMSVAYLLGFFLVVVCGARWEAWAPDDLLDGLCLAIGIAALLSVWILLRQWFELDTGWEWWSMECPAPSLPQTLPNPIKLPLFYAWVWAHWPGVLGAAVFAGLWAYWLRPICCSASR